MTENNNIVIYQSEDGKVQLNKEAKRKQIKFILIEENNSPEPPFYRLSWGLLCYCNCTARNSNLLLKSMIM